MDVPIDAPEHCPGVQSQTAGKESACHGCPNQKSCSSGEARLATAGDQVALLDIRNRLESVKHKIAILSGKGGVGKSTLSVMLARRLSKHHKVALLDIDICGPSQPKMCGLEGEQVHQSMSGWSPVYADENLCLMSVGFLLGDPDEAVVWRGPKKNGLIKQFLKDVDWGTQDYLIVDTPPGTSDEHLSLVQLLQSSNEQLLDGAILVTTPQEMALQDVRKQAAFCRKVDLPILGLVENMANFRCPKCDGESAIFPRSVENGGVAEFCKQWRIDFLGTVPIDPKMARACDEGGDYLTEFAQSSTATAIGTIVSKIEAYCENR